MSNTQNSGEGYSGQQGLGDANTLASAVRFLVQQLLANIQTAAIVQVKAVMGGGTDGPAVVNVQPLVNLVDGQGTNYPHGIINGLPAIRIQGGPNAIICDPEVGDLGIALICNRDTSIVKSKMAQAQPGSYRKFDWADGFVLCCALAGAPTQYLQFLMGGGLKLVDKYGNQISMTSDGITIQACDGGTVTIDDIEWDTHVHTDVSAGSDDTGGPIAG